MDLLSRGTTLSIFGQILSGQLTARACGGDQVTSICSCLNSFKISNRKRKLSGNFAWRARLAQACSKELQEWFSCDYLISNFFLQFFLSAQADF
jgi:hypothetical protein